MTTTHAQITGTHVIYGDDPQTHVSVDVFQVVSPGVRSKIASYDISLPGAVDNSSTIRSGVEAFLQTHGLMKEGDRVLTESEARAAMIAGVEP